MNDELDKALLKIIQDIARHFGPTAVLKGGMCLRLKGIPRFTNDADFCFQPFKRKKPFMDELIQLMNKSCDTQVEAKSDSTKLQILGKVFGTEVMVEVTAHEAFEPNSCDTSLLSKKYDLPTTIISIMPEEMSFADKLGAWYERRLSRDLYDIFIFYEYLKIVPDKEILLNRIGSPKFARNIKHHSKLESVDQFLEFIKKECNELDPKQLEDELEGVVEERERAGLGQMILLTIQRMKF